MRDLNNSNSPSSNATSCSTKTNISSAPPKNTHLVIFVHGWSGNETNFDYLSNTMENQAAKAQRGADDDQMDYLSAYMQCEAEKQGLSGVNIVPHKVTCNVGKTNDGIVRGGKRLACEVQHKLNDIEGHVYLSFVGHSLGGLYSRYAISQMKQQCENVTPFIFCTIATPHLGLHNKHNHLNLSTKIESILGKVMGQTFKDVLCQNTIIEEMGTSEAYLAPLRRFRRRLALANAFRTDFVVPAQTAAFLSSTASTTGAETTSLHILANDMSADTKHHTMALTLKTLPTIDYNENDISESLDALGWTKIFLDIRDDIQFPTIKTRPFKKKRHQGPVVAPTAEKTAWTPAELLDIFNSKGPTWKPPLAHNVTCAISRKNLKGRPTMDQLGKDLIDMMLQHM